ncbi:hypothetical protein JAAARDRAFT_60490 [Jaapia argillacea MUCL 33604]|uniref:Uncharacterized protein n=1 Tax=Jaapia argillacea MUCL 33604 TaxID=933084 RepID=A0A067PVY0_9AGAM|nr:hypothetical protein JAAARDRAFT_60490 [Jaapia argillacea MUCL 33604]
MRGHPWSSTVMNGQAQDSIETQSHKRPGQGPQATRPTKRPRLAPQDGFSTSKPSCTSTTKKPPPRLISAFDGSSGASTSTVPARKPPVAAASSLELKPNARAELPRSDHSAEVKVPKPPLKQLKVPTFPNPTPREPIPPNGDPSHLPATSAISLTARLPLPLDVLKTPQVRRLPVPRIPFADSSPGKSLGSFNPLSLRPLPDRPRSRKPFSKTISTTRVALATAPNSEGGPAELFSLYIQQKSPTRHDTHDRCDAYLAIGFSPEKIDRVKGRKFVRNGLADHASRVLSRTQTSLSLWHKSPSNLSSAADMRVTIVEILHIAPTIDRSSPLPRSILARCQIVPETMSPFSQPRPIFVSFLFPSSTALDSTRVAGEADFQVGKEVNVWRPWHTIDLPSEGKQDGRPPAGESPAILCSRFSIPRMLFREPKSDYRRGGR